jgi:hypothetical protein
MSSLIILGIEKGSSSKRLLILVPLLRALTLVLSITIVCKEMPSPTLLVINLENRIAIIINKSIIKGLLNCLIVIKKALKE